MALVLLGTLAHGAATASASESTPKANIPIGTLPAACTSEPDGVECTNAVVAALDSARADLGLVSYALPADFDSLAGEQQLFVLANLDRVTYGLPPIAGLSPTLDAAASTGMADDIDPNPTGLLGALPDYAWSSNWAGDWANAPYAYYEWMYDDGYGGGETSNIDCTSPTARGCWDHRRDVLSFAASGTLSMGAAVGLDTHGGSSYAMTLVWTTKRAWTTYSYTWAQAHAAGAGVLASSARSKRATKRARLARSASAQHR